MTNFARIENQLRTVCGLADFLIEHGIDDIASYCKELPECCALIDAGNCAPEWCCQKCLEEWLLQEVTSDVK